MIKNVTGRAAIVLATFFVLLATVMTIAILSNSALAIGSSHTGNEVMLKGEVWAVDNLHNINMLTLQSNTIGQFPNDQLNIFMNKNTSVKICNEREAENDINVSRKATVTYHEVQGLLPLADSVTEKC